MTEQTRCLAVATNTVVTWTTKYYGLAAAMRQPAPLGVVG